MRKLKIDFCSKSYDVIKTSPLYPHTFLVPHTTSQPFRSSHCWISVFFSWKLLEEWGKIWRRKKERKKQVLDIFLVFLKHFYTYYKHFMKNWSWPILKIVRNSQIRVLWIIYRSIYFFWWYPSFKKWIVMDLWSLWQRSWKLLILNSWVIKCWIYRFSIFIFKNFLENEWEKYKKY